MTKLKKEKKPVENFPELKCPLCGKKNYYYRSKNNDYLCRGCGCVFHITKENKISTILPWIIFLKSKK